MNIPGNNPPPPPSPAPASFQTTTMQPATSPRVGGISHGTAWTGGSSLVSKRNKDPVDILCFRPNSFKDMQKQHESLKKGLESDKRLEIDDGSKVTVGLTMWVTWMSMMFVNKGMDTVFMIINASTGIELNLLKTWGEATLPKVQAWVKELENTGDKWDLENLRLSAFAVRNSLGTNLLNRVISFVGAEASGPVLFFSAISQVHLMTAGLVRGLCDSIVNMDLKKIVGENVAQMSEKIMNLIRQIESSGTVPSDLLYLVSKPYTTGTHETFRAFAQGVYAQILDASFLGDYTGIIIKMNSFYQNLLQSGDYSPSKTTKKDQDSVLQSMMAKMDNKINNLKMKNGGGGGHNKKEVTCYNCGKPGHIKPKCPDLKPTGGNNKDNQGRPQIEAWRKVAPKSGEPNTKKHNGVTTKWCQKCSRGKGMWHLGDKAHSTADHKTVKELNAEGPPSTEAGNLAQIQGDVEIDSEQLEVSFR